MAAAAVFALSYIPNLVHNYYQPKTILWNSRGWFLVSVSHRSIIIRRKKSTAAPATVAQDPVKYTFGWFLIKFYSKLLQLFSAIYTLTDGVLVIANSIWNEFSYVYCFMRRVEASEQLMCQMNDFHQFDCMFHSNFQRLRRCRRSCCFHSHSLAL